MDGPRRILDMGADDEEPVSTDSGVDMSPAVSVSMVRRKSRVTAMI